MKFGDDGRLYAINPEAGFFGVAPGTGEKTNPNAMAHARARTSIFTNCALHRRRRHLVGGHDRRAARPPDRLARQRLDARRPTRPRRTPTPASPRRPRSARRSPPSGRTRPACRSTPSCSAAAAPPSCRWSREAFDWEHGVFLGATMSSETTAAAAGAVGELRRDPFAMLPFCGYNMGDYFAPLARDRRARRARKLPRIFYVNWFRKDDDGQFLWPGFGENSRVLEWVFRRCEGEAEAVETPIGLRSRPRGRDRHRRPRHLRGGDGGAALRVDPEDWRARAARACTSTSPRSATRCRPSCTTQLARLERRLG